MTHKELMRKIIDESASYEDGTMGVDECIYAYCEDHGIAKCHAISACRQALEENALAAGIPLSVIRGEKTLRECFSQDYIDRMTNKTKDHDE